MFEFKPTEISIIDPEPERTTFTETFVWEPATLAENNLGRLYLVGQILSSEGRVKNAEILLKIADLIKNEYYRNPNRDALPSFRFALGKVNSVLRGQFKINIAVAAITESALVTACLGDGAAYVLRSGVLAELKTKTGVSFANIAHGDIRTGDSVIIGTPQLNRLGTKRLAELVAAEKLTEFFKENETEFKNLGCIAIACNKSGLPRPALSPALAGSVKKRRPARLLAQLGILAAVIALTVAALAFERNLAQKELEADKVLASLARFKTETIELLKIGNLAEAERLFNEWQLAVLELEALGVKQKETAVAREEIDGVEPLVLRYETISPHEVIGFEKSAVDFLPNGLVSSKNGFLLFDEKSLYDFNLRTESGGFTVVPAEFSVKDIALPDSDDYFIILSEAAVFEYGNDELHTLVATGDNSLSRVEFYNDTVYILGSTGVWIIRQEKLAPWLKPSSTIEAALDFTIDGFIYILQDSRVIKLLNGEKKGEFKVDSGSEKIYTQSSFRNLYLLNPRDGVVQIMEKSSGSASRRLEHESLKGARALTVSGNEKTLYFLSGERVFSVEL